jgi:hypothetical protein
MKAQRGPQATQVREVEGYLLKYHARDLSISVSKFWGNLSVTQKNLISLCGTSQLR